MKRNTIHIAPGYTSGGCIKRVKGIGRDSCFINVDELSNGPLVRFQALDAWLRVRNQHWRQMQTDPRVTEIDYLSSGDIITGLDALRTADEIILWLGTSTDEQLLLTWMVQFLRVVGIDLDRLCVIQFDHVAVNWQRFVTVGVLNLEQLRAHPKVVQLTSEEIAEIDAAWSAVTSPNPLELTGFLADARRSLPFLKWSLRSLIFRYPDLNSGLNRWDMQLLRYVRSEGPKVARVVGHTMAHEMDFPEWLGDLYLFHRLRRLGNQHLAHPFVVLSGSMERMGEARVELTESGSQALEGGANFVELNGIDDWVGGVHLNSRTGNVWYRDGARLLRA